MGRLCPLLDALVGAGVTTRNGKPLSPSTVKLQLQRLGLAPTRHTMHR